MKAPLVSLNPTCRRIGCQTYVPSGGGYPGMTQSHCYRCGMRTGHAADFCKDFEEPIQPEVHLYDRVVAFFRRVFA